LINLFFLKSSYFLKPEIFFPSVDWIDL